MHYKSLLGVARITAREDEILTIATTDASLGDRRIPASVEGGVIAWLTGRMGGKYFIPKHGTSSRYRNEVSSRAGQSQR